MFDLFGNAAVSGKRVWEIDYLRALAIVLMVIFHLMFDLSYFASVNINTASGFWYWEGKASALLFIFIAGLSCGFSRNILLRSLRVLAAALLLTVATYFFFRSVYIRFGILHLLTAGMLLYPMLKRLNSTILALFAAIIAAAAVPFESMTIRTSLLLPVGIKFAGFSSLDYYPVCPYLAVFILGMLAFKLYYFKRKSVFVFECGNKYILLLSRHSLAIYLIHQPVIIAVILFTGRIKAAW